MTLSPRSFLLCSGLVTACVIGAMWLYTSLMPMYFLEGGYPIWVAKQALLRSCDFGSVLVMGDSRPEPAIVPSELGFPAANISSGAATPIENYFFAQQALRCPIPPRIVLYSHSLSSFGLTNEFLWTNAVRYGFVTFRDLRTIAQTAAVLRDDSLDHTDTHDGLRGALRDVIYGYGFPTIFSGSLLKARGFGRYAANIALFDHTMATRGGVAYPERGAIDRIGVDARVTKFAALPIQKFYFERTLEILAAANVKVLFVPIPVSISTMTAMKSGVAEDFARFLGLATQHHPNVVVIYPTMVGWPDDLFVDGMHMNERGAALFTQRLAVCLREMDKTRDHPAPCDLAWKPPGG